VILILQILKNKLFGAASPSNSNQPFPGPVGNERRKLAKAKKSQTVKFKRKVKPSCILSSRFTIKSRTASIVRKKLWTPFQIRLIKYKKRSMPAHAGKQQRQQQQLSDRQHLQQLISNGKNNKHC
jgi:hypothetical protein